MRVWIVSDLHVEFDHFDLPINLQFDVAVFAGDIWRPISNAIRWLTIQREGPLKGKPVILVPGNHEFYGHEVGSSRAEGRQRADEVGIHLLDPGTVTIGGVRFVGSTLWTDYGLYGRSDASRRVAARAMNDHKRIFMAENGHMRRFTPDDAFALHVADREFIEATLSQPFVGPTVVITHHAPHPGSIPPEYRGDPLTAAFASDLSSLIARYQPDVWVHGHDHHQHDYVVAETRIVANPAGYPRANGRENKLFDPYFTITV